MRKIEEIITQHREIEEILSKSFKEVSDIKFALDASSIVAITDQKGKILSINDKFCEISKYKREELLGQDHRIISSGYHSKEFIRNLWRTIAQGNVWKGEIKNKAKDGSFYWVDTTIVPFLNKERKPYQYIAIRNEITQRKQAEEELKQLPQRILQAQEAEQSRISREIHDDLGQSLVTSKLLLQSLGEDIGFKDISLKQKYERLVNYQDDLIEKAQSIAASLRPTALQEYGLTRAIKIMMAEFKEKKGLKIELHTCLLDKLNFQTEPINIYRIIQESLTNVIKHAKATKVNVSVRKNKKYGKNLLIRIKDNGKGFSQKAVGKRIEKHLGLSTMEERARLLGGSLQIKTFLNKGTEIILLVPFKEGIEKHV